MLIFLNVIVATLNIHLTGKPDINENIYTFNLFVHNFFVEDIGVSLKLNEMKGAFIFGKGVYTLQCGMKDIPTSRKCTLSVNIFNESYKYDITIPETKSTLLKTEIATDFVGYKRNMIKFMMEDIKNNITKQYENSTELKKNVDRIVEEIEQLKECNDLDELNKLYHRTLIRKRFGLFSY